MKAIVQRLENNGQIQTSSAKAQAAIREAAEAIIEQNLVANNQSYKYITDQFARLKARGFSVPVPVPTPATLLRKICCVPSRMTSEI